MIKKQIIDSEIDTPNELMPELKKKKDISLNQILNNLLNKTDLELKTEIHQPKALAIFRSIMIYCKKQNYNNSALTLKIFLRNYLENMVSFKRKSRTEVIKALTSLLPNQENEMTTSKKLVSNLK